MKAPLCAFNKWSVSNVLVSFVKRRHTFCVHGANGIKRSFKAILKLQIADSRKRATIWDAVFVVFVFDQCDFRLSVSSIPQRSLSVHMMCCSKLTAHAFSSAPVHQHNSKTSKLQGGWVGGRFLQSCLCAFVENVVMCLRSCVRVFLPTPRCFYDTKWCIASELLAYK